MKGHPARHIRRHADRDAGVKSAPLAGSRTPFKAAIKQAQAHQNALDIIEPAHRQLALDAIPALRSRGHGGKRNPFQRIVLGRATRDRSKYVPATEERKHRRQRVLGRISAYLSEGV